MAGGRNWLRKAAMLLALCAGGVAASDAPAGERPLDRGSGRAVPS